ELTIGDAWGKLFDCAWFHFRGTVPKSAAGRKVVLLLDVNGELCVFDSKGVPTRGLTTKSSHFGISPPGKRVVQVSARAAGGERIDLWADGGCNDLFGKLQNGGTLETACVALCDDKMRQLAFDYFILYDFLASAPKGTPRSRQIEHALWQVNNTLVDYTPKEVNACLRMLKPILAKKTGDASLQITAIGHGHLDLAWLWPERETRRKGARTFATALELLDRYPEYHFGASQPQLFQWIKEDYPALYKRVKKAVAGGRFECQGAMWVESDTNVPCGESLVRQLLYGKRFFKQEFDVDMNYLWLPDVFGYNAALPQILKLAGVDYFMTMKLSWSLINQFPHHAFHWQGIDGSRVLAKMLPEGNYNSPATPRVITKIEKEYLDSDVSDQTLMLFGIGDGGGGPGAEHLESLRRVSNFAGLPPIRQEPAAAFFPRWAKDADSFATWVGELYLERHQGTFTTQARTKWYNRRIEQAVRELEFTAACAVLVAGKTYPREKLLQLWQRILFLQFHDILPGSSIKRVYDECKADYARMLKEIDTELAACREGIAKSLAVPACDKPYMIGNSVNWERSDWLKLEDNWQLVTVPSMSFSVVDAALKNQEEAKVKARTNLLENECLRVRFHKNGAIRSIVDKAAGRELLTPGRLANRFTVYEDEGSAWDFPMKYADKRPQYMALESSRASTDGPLGILTQRYRLNHSVLEQRIILKAGSPLIEFDTRLTWREIGTMLRTSFPVDVLTDHATCEIQFGSIERSTHRNTTWDMAQDEIPAQRWVDLSERGYGVALINDSKYGHKVKDCVLDLNLLRSVPHTGERVFDDRNLKPGEPNHVYGDQEDHEFRYALYPHAGDHVQAQVVRKASEFNLPLTVSAMPAATGDNPVIAPVQVDSESVVIEAVKLAEDRDTLVVRMYESAGASTAATIHFGMPIKTVDEVNLMEETMAKLKPDGQTLKMAFKPFQIRTIEISPLGAGRARKHSKTL
ncbi:MAG: alpha-mannosidase, partial [Planctomycetota bacterium]